MSKKRTQYAPKNAMNFAAALKSFMGYLEGTQKSRNTIKSYRLDLLAFDSYLRHRNPGPMPSLQDLSFQDMELFHQKMRTDGLRANTRRRRILTMRHFMVYLAGRNKVPDSWDRQFPTPAKVERIPATVDSTRLLGAIRSLPSETELEARNRVLLWILAETGCLVSEVTHLRFDQFQRGEGRATLEMIGKNARKLLISLELWEAIGDLRIKAKKPDEWLFLGFNKFGSMGKPITARGVELLVRQYASRLVPQAESPVTPRTFRQSAVLRWFAEGFTQEQIRTLLGLKTPYAFKAYEPLLKQKSSDPAQEPHPFAE